MKKGPYLIYYLVKALKEKYPDKQVGKTKLQKLMYILETKSKEDFNYSMYHYGPFSTEIEEYINIAEVMGLLQIKWIPDKGYFIEPLMHSKSDIEDDKIIKQIDQVVSEFGYFTANELSIISTALYVRDNFNVTEDDKIVEAVLHLKPGNKEDWIRKLLKKASII